MKKQKIVLITGISRGIGKTLALNLSNEGYKVYGTSRYPEKIEDKIEGVKYLQMDLSDENSIEKCFNSASEIDVLINNAGQSQMGPAEELPQTKIREIFEVNFFGTISLTQKFVGRMRKSNSGLVINIGSLSGKFSVPFQSTYASSKMAINTWTLCLRKELLNFNVNVCSIDPYIINSGIKLDYVCDNDSDYRNISERVYEIRKEKLKKAYSTMVVLKTVRKAMEAKKPKASYISGRRGLLFSFVYRFISIGVAERLINKFSGIT